MSKLVVASNEYITVECHPNQNLISHTIHRPIGSAQDKLFADALNAGTEALRKHKITKWLSDDRKNGPLTPEILEWAFTDWNARTIAAGWKYWANIVPQELIAAGTLQAVMDDLSHHGLQMRVFTNVEDGVAWLASV